MRCGQDPVRAYQDAAASSPTAWAALDHVRHEPTRRGDDAPPGDGPSRSRRDAGEQRAHSQRDEDVGHERAAVLSARMARPVGIPTASIARRVPDKGWSRDSRSVPWLHWNPPPILATPPSVVAFV